MNVGAAEIDITPDFAVDLSGFAARTQHDRSAFAGERQGSGPAETLRASGDDGDLAVQPRHGTIIRVHHSNTSLET